MAKKILVKIPMLFFYAYQGRDATIPISELLLFSKTIVKTERKKMHLHIKVSI